MLHYTWGGRKVLRVIELRPIVMYFLPDNSHSRDSLIDVLIELGKLSVFI